MSATEIPTHPPPPPNVDQRCYGGWEFESTLSLTQLVWMVPLTSKYEKVCMIDVV